MGYIPIFLDVTGRQCVVVGGGEVAARKVESLLRGRRTRHRRKSAACSPPIAAIVAQRLVRSSESPQLSARRHARMRAGRSRDRRSRTASRAGRRGARARIPLNVVDVPELCTFIAPAVVNAGRSANRNLDRRRVAGICGAA